MPEVVARKGVRTTAPRAAQSAAIRAGQCVVLKVALLISFESFFYRNTGQDDYRQAERISGKYASGKVGSNLLGYHSRSTIRNEL